MHDRAHGRLVLEGSATAHDVNHLTVLSHDQLQPFMTDTWDWPQWPVLDVSGTWVIEQLHSMVTLSGPPGENHPWEWSAPPRTCRFDLLGPARIAAVEMRRRQWVRG